VGTKFRTQSIVLAQLQTITVAEHNTIKAASKNLPRYWIDPPSVEEPIVNRFREEIKDHYFWGQARRCCYCSFELQNNKRTYDAEHILDRADFPEFAFETNNIAAACKPCNGGKSSKSALLNGEPKPSTVPTDSASYLIVHPHLDCWDQHLEFDAIERIKPKNGSLKGQATVSVCAIDKINSARLSDHFAPDRKGAENALRGYFRVTDLAWKRRYLQILRKLAVQYALASAAAIVDHLEVELNQV
jgi:hypothetical protein